MGVCYQLWDSWEPGAIIADKASGIYADPSKIKSQPIPAEVIAKLSRS